ncbi:hypothetical protein SH661x_000569 [Planctomicrobium sp. SH661]|uniref:hypothetical protein n=1 Tax=Planctomicrobium sp. SH661 TaxID=3448124 RepID=UPI003F5B7F57
MIRNLTRNLICFSAAVVLLSLMVCAGEIFLRVWRLRSQLQSGQSITQVEEIVAPSSTSWIDVKPLLDLQRENGTSSVIRIQTNEHGLRGPSVIVPKPRGTYRVLCMGGDNVFGSEIPEKETLPGRLQRALNMQAGMPVEVINAGCPNAGPLINLLRYRTHLAALQPDLVILCLSEEDLGFDRDVRGGLHLDASRNPAYASHPALRGQGSAVLDGLCNEFLTINWLLSWAGDMTGMQSGNSRRNTVPSRENLQRDLAAIVPLAGQIHGNFGQLMISISPSAWSVDRARNLPDNTQASFADDVRKFLSEVHLAERVEVQDGLTVFCRAPDARKYFSPETGGLSIVGNDVYAQQISAFVFRAIPGLGGTSTASPGQSPNSSIDPIPFSTDQTQRQPVRTIVR